MGRGCDNGDPRGDRTWLRLDHVFRCRHHASGRQHSHTSRLRPGGRRAGNRLAGCVLADLYAGEKGSRCTGACRIYRHPERGWQGGTARPLDRRFAARVRRCFCAVEVRQWRGLHRNPAGRRASRWLACASSGGPRSAGRVGQWLPSRARRCGRNIWCDWLGGRQGPDHPDPVGQARSGEDVQSQRPLCRAGRSRRRSPDP